jgi:hypothetical protein
MAPLVPRSASFGSRDQIIAADDELRMDVDQIERKVVLLHPRLGIVQCLHLGRGINPSFINIRAFFVRTPVTGGVDFRKPRCPVALVINIIFPDLPCCVVHQQ